MLQALASVDASRKVEQLTQGHSKTNSLERGRVRALLPWGEDKDLLATINHGEFLLNAGARIDPEGPSYAPHQVQNAVRAILVAVLTTARTSVNQLNQLGKAA